MISFFRRGPRPSIKRNTLPATAVCFFFRRGRPLERPALALVGLPALLHLAVITVSFTSPALNRSGFLPYYGRCGGHTVTMFVFVDQLRLLYRQMQ